MSNPVITVDEVTNYLGIDEPDEMVTVNISRSIATADSYLKGSIGENYPTADSRVKELALMIVCDLYENRGMTSAISGNTRKLVHDMSLQLRMELRGRFQS